MTETEKFIIQDMSGLEAKLALVILSRTIAIADTVTLAQKDLRSLMQHAQEDLPKFMKEY